MFWKLPLIDSKVHFVLSIWHIRITDKNLYAKKQLLLYFYELLLRLRSLTRFLQQNKIHLDRDNKISIGKKLLLFRHRSIKNNLCIQYMGYCHIILVTKYHVFSSLRQLMSTNNECLKVPLLGKLSTQISDKISKFFDTLTYNFLIISSFF